MPSDPRKSTKLTTMPHQMSVVLLGREHNPSILNPDFLWRNRIVSEETELVDSDNNFSTPLRSIYTFENGLRIESNPERVVFAVYIEKTNLVKSAKNVVDCISSVEKYLRVVSLVQYVAVGINFASFVTDVNGKIDPYNMIESGDWCKLEGKTPSAEVNFSYRLAKREVNLSVKREIIGDVERKAAVLVHANFHHTIKAKNESNLEAIGIVVDWHNDVECFDELVAKMQKGIQK